MTNIEKALHWAETLIQQTDEHLPCCSEVLKIELVEQREFAVTAIAALQEKLARENGCKWCGTGLRFECCLIDDEGNTASVKDNIVQTVIAEYRPVCGKGVKHD